MTVRLRCLVLAACAALAFAGEPGLQPTGLLHAEYRIDQPLAPDGTTVLTAHLVNVCEAPVRLTIRELTYQTLFIDCHLPAAKSTSHLDHEVWGPVTAAPVKLDLERIRMSGIGDDGRIPHWPKREGVVLLQDEGYARIVTFLPGWTDAKTLPAEVHGVVLMTTPPLAMALPKLERSRPGSRSTSRRRTTSTRRATADPVPPRGGDAGAGAGRAAGAGTGRPAPTHRAAGDRRGGQRPRGRLPGRQRRRQDRVGAPERPRRAARDVGNPAPGRGVATVDGAALRGLLDLLPERAPLALNSGEYLSYRRVLLASSLPLKHGETCTLRLRLDAPWNPTAPGEQDQPQMAALTATVALPVQ